MSSRTSLPVVFTRAGAWRGVGLCLPVLMGVLPFGLVCGIVSQGAGLSLLETTLMSASVFAGSAQLVVLANWSDPAPILGAALATLAVNLRLALMGPVLAPWLDQLRGWRLWSSLFLMVDQNWALAVGDMNAGRLDAGVMLGSGLTMWAVWVASTVAGFLAGAVVHPPPAHPLFFSALAVFVAMLATMWRGRADLMPWGVAAVVAMITARLAPSGAWYIVAGSLAGSIAGALRDEAKR